MSDQNAQEPTMEEILASIRRIISEDDVPADAAAPEAAAAPEPEPEPAPAAPAYTPPPLAVAPEPEEDDVLDLTDPITTTETHGDLDIYTAPPEPEPVFAAAPEPAPPPPAPAPVEYAAPRAGESLLSDTSARASASAFSSLAAAIAMPAPGRTLEEVTRELLKPLLAAWLDENLPRIVEAKVAEEVERIARGR